MTYIEKLMTAIKFDDEMLTADEIGMLRGLISEQICDRYCPANIKFLQGPGLYEDEDDCPVAGPCLKCWNMEAEEDAVNE